MVANCKALSRLISVYAIAIARARENEEGTNLHSPYFFSPPHHVATGCCCCFLPCASVCLSIPSPLIFLFCPGEISACFPHLPEDPHRGPRK